MRWSTLCPLPAGSAVLRDARCWHGGCAGTFPLHHVFVPGLHHRFHRKCFFLAFFLSAGAPTSRTQPERSQMLNITRRGTTSLCLSACRMRIGSTSLRMAGPSHGTRRRRDLETSRFVVLRCAVSGSTPACNTPAVQLHLSLSASA